MGVVAIANAPVRDAPVGDGPRLTFLNRPGSNLEDIGQGATDCPHLRSLESARHAEVRCDLVNQREQLVSVVALTRQRLCFPE